MITLHGVIVSNDFPRLCSDFVHYRNGFELLTRLCNLSRCYKAPRWHFCRANFGPKDFFELRIFLTKNAPKFFLEIFEPLFCRSRRNPTKFQPNFPQIFPSKHMKKITDELLQERRENKTYHVGIGLHYIIALELTYRLCNSFLHDRIVYTDQMDAAVPGSRLLEVPQKPFLGSSRLSLHCHHWESSNALAGLVFCEMLSQYPWSAFSGSPRVARAVSGSLRPKPSVHLLGLGTGFEFIL